MPAPILHQHTAHSLKSSFSEQLPHRSIKPSRFRYFIKNRYVQLGLYGIGAVGLIVIALFIGATLGKKSFQS